MIREAVLELIKSRWVGDWEFLSASYHDYYVCCDPDGNFLIDFFLEDNQLVIDDGDLNWLSIYYCDPDFLEKLSRFVSVRSSGVPDPNYVRGSRS